MPRHRTHNLMLTQILDGNVYEDIEGNVFKAMNDMKTKDAKILYKKLPSGWCKFSGLLNIHKEQFKQIEEAPSVELKPFPGLV